MGGGLKIWTIAALSTIATPLSVEAMPLGPKVGDQAPNFELLLLDHTKVSLADLKGQVIVINLWASWCGPCKQEMPILDYMQRNLADRGLRVIGVVTNDSVDQVRVRNVSKVLGYSISMRITGKYPAGKGLPTSYVIDRKGVIRYIEEGAFTAESFASLIGPLLNEKAS
ncbi:MAG: TlpA family protein disulfide reductase [Sphingomonas bacterium]|uniref:TlpA family protein disulfide reductase n=1 Tax=Sphingomonas bacterium TaxID=1895847 RepID=UPI0026391DE8|nr:TlpA disulfide reductase family protein [Sphingomonas bacterium]MDB5707422.1 TlpA family protein disulfide reductase [Sphingomonas bacterium]